ncbi:MAG: cell division topological specificity factor MinE [Gammaproteobacteria bacterium]|nr:MAG: cell division topological specificity factor MinE [Gammaproteobacteria bacterium]
MSFWDYFKTTRKNTASVAKERLQIIVTHERTRRSQPDYLPELQREILEVIRKYVSISQDDVQVQLNKNDNCSVLELDVTLPDEQADN